MKKRPKYWILAVGVCVLFLLPDGINFSIDVLNDIGKIDTKYRLEEEAWRDAIAVMIPTVLSFFVFKQSEIQQMENDKTQNRLEGMNKKLLENELKSNLGYFVPVLYKKEEKNWGNDRKIDFHHPLEKYILLRNQGNDLVFVYHEEILVDDKVIISRELDDICFLNYSELSEAKLELSLSENILQREQMDVVITLSMRNSRGYAYKQRLLIGFKCKNGYGLVNKFNMIFQEESANAH